MDSRNETTTKISSVVPASPDAWPLSLTAMTRRFPAIDSKFLARLVRILPANVTDEELAGALALATTLNQKTAGLWLTTIPATIANQRRERKKFKVGELRASLTEARRSLGEAERLKDREWYEELQASIAQHEALLADESRK